MYHALHSDSGKTARHNHIACAEWMKKYRNFVSEDAQLLPPNFVKVSADVQLWPGTDAARHLVLEAIRYMARETTARCGDTTTDLEVYIAMLKNAIKDLVLAQSGEGGVEEGDEM
jgi:hypothetical protein